MVAALLLDLDDTLIDDRGAMAAAALLFRQKHSLCLDEQDFIVSARWDSVGRTLWSKLAIGEVSFDQQRRERLRETFYLEISDSEADDLFQDYLYFYEMSWKLFPDTEVFLDATAHLPRAILTNGHRPQAHKKLLKLGLEGHFHHVITPEDCGARKPQAKFFQHALDLLGHAPQDCVMIGDNLEADIEPARALGLRVFHVDSREAGRSVIDALSLL
jgi:putative hydrolase of the HAD superfamily